MLKIAYNNFYVQPLPEGHRFPMEKYDLLPRQLLYEGTVDESNFFNPARIVEEFVIAVHDAEYVKALKELKLTPREQRKTGFPHSQRLIEREHIIMEGTRKACEFALEYGVAMNIAGGTHHAYTNRGEGFCLLNDIAIAANWLLEKQKAQQILVVDLDVHQGNGTAEIFKNEPRVFTFSMHGKNNYPLKKEISDKDVPLEDGIKDKDYLYMLEYHLDAILKEFVPDFILYQSGVDIIETDKLGKLSVTLKGCKKRDEIVFNIAKQNNIPTVTSMGGGYSPEIKHIIEAHANTFRSAQHIFF